MIMRMLNFPSVVLGIFLATACSDPNAPPTGLTMPSRDELKAAVPGSDLVLLTEVAEKRDLPAFLAGTGFRVSHGAHKVREGEPPNSDGGRSTYAWGLWHTFYADHWASPSSPMGAILEQHVGEKPLILIPDRSEWTQAECRGEYRDGERVGVWTFWHPNGQKKAEGEFQNDKLHGPWKVWQSTGAVDEQHTGTYENGKKV